MQTAASTKPGRRRRRRAGRSREEGALQHVSGGAGGEVARRRTCCTAKAVGDQAVGGGRELHESVEMAVPAGGADQLSLFLLGRRELGLGGGEGAAAGGQAGRAH